MNTHQALSRAVGLLTLLCLAFPAFAQTETVDFSQFDPGETIDNFAICDGDVNVTVRGDNLSCPDLNAAIVFDSNCSGAGCSGNDPDLGVNLGNLLIVHEHCSELDGFVEDPDDDADENEVYFTFDEPITFCEYTAIDNEFEDEIDNAFFYSNDDFTGLIATANTPFTGDAGVVDVSTFAEENGSGAINEDGCVEGVRSIRFFRRGSRGLTNLDLVCTPPPPPPDCEEGRCFETFLIDSEIDVVNDEYTYTFETCKISSFCRGFSFVAIEIPEGAEVLSASRSYSTNSNGRFDPDDYDFIKFEDIGGSGNVSQCESITFTLDTPYAEDAEVDVRVKFGRTQTSNQDKIDDFLANLGVCTDGEARSSAPFFDLARTTTPSSAAITAYPNPMTSRTTFSVTLEEAAEVRLVIYDVLGREVGVITEGSFLPGTMSVSYDASNLPNGTYFYRLDASGNVTTGQLQVVR